jgi:pyruvate dehydrogenase E2 component (dihydrolipoamide acetyltransferase)
MPRYIELPQMTDTMTEGVVSAWLKDEGEEVRQGDPIAEIETDKAVMELESPSDGVLLRRYVDEHVEVACGTVVAAIGDAGEAVDDAPQPVSKDGDAEPTSSQSSVDVREERQESQPEPSASPDRVVSSPAARRKAEERGVDLSSVAGSGPGGRIVMRDVETAAGEEPVKRIPLSRKRRVMIERLIETHQSVPAFTVTRHFDCDRLVRFREELKHSADFADGIGYTELFVKAVALASVREPSLNARFAGNAIYRFSEVNIGVAVGLDDGVVVPVIRGCERKPLVDIVRDFRRLTERVRNGTLLANELTGSTFTISNLGMYGVDEFAAVINAPDAAILALGSITDRAVVRNGAVVAAKVMTGTLTVDHRVADGVAAGRWLAELAALLQEPGGLIA